MPKSYRQYCGLARGLDLVGERWTLLVVRNLLLGPKRYGDLLASLPGITTNLLAKRLREMQASGLVVRATLPAPANVQVYALGPEGRALEPAIMELARWGGRFMGAPRRDDTLDIGWGLLSTKRRYRGGSNLRAALRIDDRTFALELEPEYLRVEERDPGSVDLVLVGSTEAFRAFLFAGDPTRARLLGLGIEPAHGTVDDLERFLAAFGPPERPPAAASEVASKPKPRRAGKDGASRAHRLSSRRP